MQQLRAWPRWLQRCQDMGMAVPDGSVLAKGLTLLTSSTIEKVPDAMFRTQLVRATLRIDQQPSLQDVLKYQRHLQAEVESFASSVSTTVTSPAVRATGVPVGGQQAPAGGTKPGCKYFLRRPAAGVGRSAPILMIFQGSPRLREVASVSHVDQRNTASRSVPHGLHDILLLARRKAELKQDD